MELDQLKYLIEIANNGSLTATAQKLHVSQPNVSRAIASLEQELGAKIFTRSRLGAFPTETGQLIIQLANDILLKTEELKIIAKNNAPLSANLSIATVPSMCSTILPTAVGTFNRKYSNIQINITEENTNQIVDLLTKGTHDIGLVASHDYSDFSENFIFHPLLISEVVACVCKNSPLADKRAVSYQELINYPIVLLNREYRQHQIILDNLMKFGKPNILLTARNFTSIRKLVADGLAIGFNLDITLKTDLNVLIGDIIPITMIDAPRTVIGILHTKKKLEPYITEFCENLVTQAAIFSRIYNLPAPPSIQNWKDLCNSVKKANEIF